MLKNNPKNLGKERRSYHKNKQRTFKNILNNGAQIYLKMFIIDHEYIRGIINYL